MSRTFKTQSHLFPRWKLWAGLLLFSNCATAQTKDVQVDLSFDTDAYKHGAYYIINCSTNDTIRQSPVCKKDSFSLDNRFEYEFIYPVKARKRNSRYGYFMLSFSDHYFYDKIAIHIDKCTNTKRCLKTNVLIHSGEKGKAIFTRPLPE